MSKLFSVIKTVQKTIFARCEVNTSEITQGRGWKSFTIRESTSCGTPSLYSLQDMPICVTLQ